MHPYLDFWDAALGSQLMICVHDKCDAEWRDFERQTVLWNYRVSTVLRVELMTSCPTKLGGLLMGQWVQQAVKAHVNNGSAVEAPDEKLEREYPALFDFLTCNIGEGGKPRAVGSLTLFARTGSWHACLKDRQTKRTWWGEGDCVDSALKALDAALQGR